MGAHPCSLIRRAADLNHFLLLFDHLIRSRRLMIQLLNKTCFFISLIWISSSLVSIHYTKKTHRNTNSQGGWKNPEGFLFPQLKTLKAGSKHSMKYLFVWSPIQLPTPPHLYFLPCPPRAQRTSKAPHVGKTVKRGHKKGKAPSTATEVGVPHEPLRLSVSRSAH